MKYRMVDVCEHNFIKNLSGGGVFSQSQKSKYSKRQDLPKFGGGGREG